MASGLSDRGTPAQKNDVDRSRHDSGFISPPTNIRYEVQSPCHYFLRGQAKWSSTPLPSTEAFITPGTGRSTSTPSLLSSAPKSEATIEIVDFQKRLENLVNGQDDEQSTFDSGFESLINSTADESCNEGNHKTKEDKQNGTVLRRSPRQMNHEVQVEGVERLTSIKNVIKPIVEEESVSLLIEKNKKFSVPNFDKFQSKKNLLKYPHISKEGRDQCDIIRFLFEKNLVHVLSIVFQHLHPEDLCQVSQVCQQWKLALTDCPTHDDRRLNHVAFLRVNRENYGQKHELRRNRSDRRIMQEVANIVVSPTNGKRDRNPSSSAFISPSKIRHKLFMDEASKLSPGERLVHCPLCTSPSRVTLCPNDSILCSNIQNSQKAQCSSPKCNFKFCPLCQCEEHDGRSCRVTRTGSSKISKSTVVTSKKSKARLRRL